MSNSINTVQISGNLGKAPEFRSEIGNGMATFNLAHNRYLPREGQNGQTEFTKRTSWFRCVAWGSVAEKVAGLGKGARVLVTGRLESRSWQDSQGNIRSAVEIVVDNVQLLETIKAENGRMAPEEEEVADHLEAEALDYGAGSAEGDDEQEEETISTPAPKRRPAVAAAKAKEPLSKVQPQPQPRYGIKSGVPQRPTAANTRSVSARSQGQTRKAKAA